MVAALESPVLVLNRNWAVVNVTTVSRALTLLFNGGAKVVDVKDYQAFDWEDWSKISPAEGDRYIQSTSIRLRVPEVVVLTEYGGMPETAVNFSRRNIFKRDHYTCQYCGVQPGTEDLTLDHVLPKSRGGETNWTNTVLACLKCNKRKADRTPEEAKMHLRHQPVKPNWKPLYSMRTLRPDSWSKFVSDVYWNVELKK